MQRIEYADLTEGEVPTPLRPRGIPRSALVAEEWLGGDHKVTQYLRNGIGVHYAALPGPVKAAIEEDFRDRKLAALAATPTLAQGVNLPIRTLIVHTTRRYDDEASEQISLTARDFWNIAGRVGRAGAETEGTVVFLSFGRNDEEDYRYFEASRNDVERVTSALFRMLNDLVTNRISRTSIARKLDAEMLALLVEEGESALTPEGLKEALGDTLFEIQGRTEHRSSDPLWRVMADTSSAISAMVTDDDLRAVYASTGLSAVSCTEISRHIAAHQDELAAAFESVQDWKSVRELLLDGLVACREMNPRTSIDAGHEQVLDHWLTGRSVFDIAKTFDVDPIRLTTFVEDFFGYRLPWGLSAYLRICAHVLQLESVPGHLEQLPLQIRYGVPSLTASWVMALGVDSRVLAVTLADAFERTGRARSPGALRRWLTSLDVEDLADQFEISLAALPTVRQVALRASGNDLMRSYYGGQDLFPLTVTVFARARIETKGLLAGLTAGMPVEVRRDYEGAHRNGVVLLVDDKVISRLPRSESDAIAIEMDAGRAVDAIVQSVSSKDAQSYRIGIVLR
ncbi:hypothetical protein [uncultured Nocardioides sp.]|uniref:hypothetical protein n=1 Tax=uncultured Nocardioides sp. TaxID=198441 RepID=UPI00261ADE98|nr:hypothetical protein [uncultured Nocardioides sp.]